MSCRRSSRIYENDKSKFLETKNQMVVLANKSTSSIKEKANNIKELYKLIYTNKELFHAYATEEYIIVFMRTYIDAGNRVLTETVLPKGVVRIMKPAIMKVIKYAEKYLQERGLLVRRALHKCEENTCYNAVCMIYSYL
jgi:glycerol-3-phosphate responsive antiterminator